MRYEGTIAIPRCRRERSCALSHRCLAQSRASDVSYVGLSDTVSPVSKDIPSWAAFWVGGAPQKTVILNNYHRSKTVTAIATTALKLSDK